jgi:hypothetical protein
MQNTNEAEILHRLMPNLHESDPVQTSALHAEKLAGNTNVHPKRAKAIGAHISRLERLMSRGKDVEGRVWDSAIDELIIDPDNIQDSYWRQQEQIARDNGHGYVRINESTKKILAEDLQSAQRSSVKSWADYFSQNGEQYPTWFKFYAWDGMSRLGTFNKEKGYFSKRDETTVAPYPSLNPAVLANVFDAVQDRFNGKDVDEVVKQGSFNRIYSHFLLSQKAILPTPEKSENVHGEWREYTADDIDAITSASEGTPWCTAGKRMAQKYTANGGKFYFFHLQDPDNGDFSPTAAASIRMQNGSVVEISGLQSGASQILEDSLVPKVVEKLKTLPGGDRYLLAFEDKQKLIAMDRKLQKGEDFTEEEIRFLYEIDRDIVPINTSITDPRLAEFKEARDFSQDMLTIFKTDDDQAIIQQLIQSGRHKIVADNLDRFSGFSGTVAEQLVQDGYGEVVGRNLDRCSEQLSNDLAEQLIQSKQGDVVVQFLEKFPELDPNDLAERLLRKNQGWSIAANPEKFPGLDRSDLAEQLIRSHQGMAVAANPEKFPGLDRSDLVRRLLRTGQSREIAVNLMNFSGLSSAVAEQLIRDGEGISVMHRLDRFSELNLEDIAQRLMKSGQGDVVVQFLEKFPGLDRSDLAEQLLRSGQGKVVIWHPEKFPGLDHNDIAEGMVKAGSLHDLAKRLHQLSGLGPNVARGLMGRDEIKDFFDNIESFSGLDYDVARTLIARHYGGKFVTDNLDRFSESDHEAIIREINQDAERRDEASRRLRESRQQEQ